MRHAARPTRLLLSVSAPLAALVFPASISAAQQTPDPWMQVTDLEVAGWSSEALEEARRYAAEIGTTAALVIERGRVIAAWGDVTARHNVYSIRKSLLGALYGIAVERGQVDLSATLSELGIDDEPPLTEQEGTARVVDLLRARSGVYHTAALETSGQEAYRPERDSYEPGTHWFYNNWDFNTLSTVYRQQTGEEVFTAFDEHLARPLGMEDFRPERDGRYESQIWKSVHPGYRFFLSARDLARFGQVWLQEGGWGEEQVVPAAWVRASVTSYSEAFDGGYGYMSWWSYPASFRAEFEYEHLDLYDSYMTTGSGGQALWIVPDLELVFVHLNDRVDDSTVGAPEYWTLLDRVLAARDGSAYRGTGPLTEPPAPEPALASVRSVPLRTDPAAGEPALVRRFADALGAGDGAAVAALVRSLDRIRDSSDPPEASELNAIGYRLLRRGYTDLALEVFRLNVDLHPRYANGWDSLGQALLDGGREQEALEAYRRAHDLDPDIGDAADVLSRLDGGKHQNPDED